MTAGRVVVVGNVGIDTQVYAPGRDIDFSVESNFTENIDSLGQAGGYATRGFARLGIPTAFIGYVGEDPNGRYIRETFAQDGVDCRALFVDPAGTSRSINFMYADGRRKNFYDGKSHMTLQPDLAICRPVLAGARLAHFNIPHWARTLLPLAKELGVTISCDIQDVVQLDDPYRQDFIEAADILFLSAVNQPDPKHLIEDLLARKPEQVVVMGRGAQGCAVGGRAGIQLFEPVAGPEPVVDTNGAGDSLAVGFLSSYVLEGRSVEDSVLRGQIAARHKCSQRARSDTLITSEALDERFRELKGSG